MVEGQIDASGRPDAFRQVEALGLRLVNLVEKTSSKAGAAGASSPLANLGKISLKLNSNKIPPRALENFTRLLSSLLAAGVPLSRALVILHREAATPAAAAKWKEIHDLVVDGLSLADAMAKSPDVFPRVYVAMVQAGETGGFLDVVLAQIADFQSREKELRSKVSSAMLYPCILVVLALGVLVFLLVFFIPNFQKLFKGFGGTLPLITQVIIAASEIVRSYGFFVIAGLVATGFLIRHWFLSAKGRRVWEGLILRAPVIGSLIAQFAMARFCRMLGTLLGAGVPLVQALTVARKSIGNQDFASDADFRPRSSVCRKAARLGESLAACRADCSP